MSSLIGVVNAAIESAVNESVLPNSKNGTVRNVARSVTQAVDGDAAVYDAIKAEVASFYDTQPLTSTAKEVIIGTSAKIATALLVIQSNQASQSAHAEPEPVVEKRAVEHPTVESLTEVLRGLGHAAEAEPESLNELITSALRRFGLD